MLRPVSWARARNCRSWRSDFVSPSLGTLAHQPSIPILESGAPEERLEASDLEAQGVEEKPLQCCVYCVVRSSSKRMRLALRRLEAFKALCLADTAVSSTWLPQCQLSTEL